jgi:hypothetical protein
MNAPAQSSPPRADLLTPPEGYPPGVQTFKSTETYSPTSPTSRPININEQASASGLGELHHMIAPKPLTRSTSVTLIAEWIISLDEMRWTPSTHHQHLVAASNIFKCPEDDCRVWIAV